MSTETNGFIFTFPEVTKAYKTSIHRKLSSNALGTILGGSLLITIGAGIGVYILHIGLQHLLNYMSRMGSCYGILGVIIYPLIVGLGGYLIGDSVGKSAIRAKFPDAQTVGKLALVIGLVGYLSYLIMYILFYYAPERFDHWIDYVRQAFYLLLFVGVAMGTATSKVEETPFCENCDDFMISDDIGDYNIMGGGKAIDIAQEATIVEILNSRQFAKLNELNICWVTGNYCVIRIWRCPTCNQNGFVDCATIKSRTKVNSKGETSTESANRVIHSSHLNGEEIQTLMQTRQILEAQKGTS